MIFHLVHIGFIIKKNRSVRINKGNTTCAVHMIQVTDAVSLHTCGKNRRFFLQVVQGFILKKTEQVNHSHPHTDQYNNQ